LYRVGLLGWIGNLTGKVSGTVLTTVDAPEYVDGFLGIKRIDTLHARDVLKQVQHNFRECSPFQPTTMVVNDPCDQSA
jgi:hypothetical protein